MKNEEKKINGFGAVLLDPTVQAQVIDRSHVAGCLDEVFRLSILKKITKATRGFFCREGIFIQYTDEEWTSYKSEYGYRSLSRIPFGPFAGFLARIPLEIGLGSIDYLGQPVFSSSADERSLLLAEYRKALEEAEVTDYFGHRCKASDLVFALKWNEKTETAYYVPVTKNAVHVTRHDFYKESCESLYIVDLDENGEDYSSEIFEYKDIVILVDGSLCQDSFAVFIEEENEYFWRESPSLCRVYGSYEYQLRDNCNWSDHHGYWIREDDSDYVFCVDIDDHVHIDSAHYYESTREWRYESLEGEYVINDYHCGPRPEHRSNSDWTIGFEVEKGSIDGMTEHGEEVDAQPFFAHWETDSSCGVEGVSNIYSLDKFEQVFIGDVNKSNYLNEEDCDTECGGHINIVGPSDLFSVSKVRGYAGLLYALYRGRLKRSYCRMNKKLQGNGMHFEKYSAMREKTTYSDATTWIEFRLVSRVQTQSQVKWRYNLFRCLSNACKYSYSWESWLKSVDGLLDEVYSKEKKSRIIEYANAFNDWLHDREYNSELIEEYTREL